MDSPQFIDFHHGTLDQANIEGLGMLTDDCKQGIDSPDFTSATSTADHCIALNAALFYSEYPETRQPGAAFALPSISVPQYSASHWFPHDGHANHLLSNVFLAGRTPPDSVSAICSPSSAHYGMDTPSAPPKAFLTAYQRQGPRFEGDLYTAIFVRGTGATREGRCGRCYRWYKLKDSAYNYHMQFTHGICYATGKPFDAPLDERTNHQGHPFEVLCASCNRWISVGRGLEDEKGRTIWYRHAFKCASGGRQVVGSSLDRNGTISYN